jgi:hypothetical protein
MTNEDPNAPTQGAQAPSRRSARQGAGGSPMGSTLSIVLAVVAVVVGFLILNNITNDSGSSDGASAVDTTVATTVASAAVETTTTVPQLVTQGATVVVANASGVSGSAGRMSAELAAVGFTMAEPTNATSGQQEQSIVYYDPNNAAAQPVAASVAQVMGGLAVETVPSPPPIEGESLGDSGVLVMLGSAQADKTLVQLSSPETPTVTSPPVAGGTTVPDTTTPDTTTPDTTTPETTTG